MYPPSTGVFSGSESRGISVQPLLVSSATEASFVVENVAEFPVPHLLVA